MSGNGCGEVVIGCCCSKQCRIVDVPYDRIRRVGCLALLAVCSFRFA